MIFGALSKPDKLGFIFVFPCPAHHYFLCCADGHSLSPEHHAADRESHGMADYQSDESFRCRNHIGMCQSLSGETGRCSTVRHHILAQMTDSELLTMMIGGMAHIAGGVMAIYIGMLAGSDTTLEVMYAKHFLAASIMAAPATLLIAKILIPETGTPLTTGKVEVHFERESKNHHRCCNWKGRLGWHASCSECCRDVARLRCPDCNGECIYRLVWRYSHERLQQPEHDAEPKLPLLAPRRSNLILA